MPLDISLKEIAERRSSKTKGHKLLMGLITLVVVVSVGGCQESGEKYEVTSESWNDAISLISDRGAAISSWTGVDGYWDTSVEYYMDMSDYGLGSDWFDYYDSYTAYDYIQAVTTESGSIAALYGYDYHSDYYGDENYCLYLDGVDAYVNYYGEVISYPGYASSYSLTDFTGDLVYLIEDSENGIVYTFQLNGLYVELGFYGDAYSITGSIEETSSGAQKAKVQIEWDHATGPTAAGYYYDDTGYMSLEIDYDIDGEITLFFYDYSDYTDWENGNEIDIVTQVISYQPYDGKIAVPSWLS